MASKTTKARRLAWLYGWRRVVLVSLLWPIVQRVYLQLRSRTDLLEQAPDRLTRRHGLQVVETPPREMVTETVRVVAEQRPWERVTFSKTTTPPDGDENE